MTIRNYRVLAVLGALLAASPAHAQDESNEQDGDYMGCGMLGAGIGAAVIGAGTATTANAWTVGLSAALGYGINREIDRYCNEVTEQTVEAFENAMDVLGIQILWHTYHDPNMEWCLSVREYDCIPYIDPEDLPHPNQLLFVQQSWEAVRSAAEHLLDSGAGNAAHITPLALANALQAGFERSGLQGGPMPFQNSFSESYQ